MDGSVNSHTIEKCKLLDHDTEPGCFMTAEGSRERYAPTFCLRTGISPDSIRGFREIER